MKKDATLRMSMFCPDDSPTPFGMDRHVTGRSAARASRKGAQNKLSLKRNQPPGHQSDQENEVPTPRRNGRHLFTRPAIFDIAEAADSDGPRWPSARPALRERAVQASSGSAGPPAPPPPADQSVSDSIAKVSLRERAVQASSGSAGPPAPPPPADQSVSDSIAKVSLREHMRRPAETGDYRQQKLEMNGATDRGTGQSRQNKMGNTASQHSDTPTDESGCEPLLEAADYSPLPSASRPSGDLRLHAQRSVDGDRRRSDSFESAASSPIFCTDHRQPAASTAGSDSDSEQSLPYFTPRRPTRGHVAPVVCESSDESGADAAPVMVISSDESDADAAPVLVNSSDRSGADAAPVMVASSDRSGENAAPIMVDSSDESAAAAAPVMVDSSDESGADVVPVMVDSSDESGADVVPVMVNSSEGSRADPVPEECDSSDESGTVAASRPAVSVRAPLRLPTSTPAAGDTWRRLGGPGLPSPVETYRPDIPAQARVVADPRPTPGTSLPKTPPPAAAAAGTLTDPAEKCGGEEGGRRWSPPLARARGGGGGTAAAAAACSESPAAPPNTVAPIGAVVARWVDESPFLTVPSDDSDVILIDSDVEWDNSDLLSVSERAAVAGVAASSGATPLRSPRGVARQHGTTAAPPAAAAADHRRLHGSDSERSAGARTRPAGQLGQASDSSEDEDQLEKFKRLFVTPRRKSPPPRSSSGDDDFINDESLSEDDTVYRRVATDELRRRNPRPEPLIRASDESLEPAEPSPDERQLPPPMPKARRPMARAALSRQPTRALSFLSSLATHVTDTCRRHPDAVAFVSSFKAKRLELARRIFHMVNSEVFESQLPGELEIKFNKRMLRTAGFCYSKQSASSGARTARVELSEKVVDCAERLRDTLVHELCHAAAWVVSADRAGHGPVWRGWAERVQRRFPELPPVSRCHSYQIHCKYTYRCTGCGYRFGRHSRSVDTKRKVCARCRGVLECVLTAQLDRAGPAAPATPRPAAPFAVFVKHNYGSVKKDGTVRKHADIMRELSKQFAQAKISKANQLATESGDF